MIEPSCMFCQVQTELILCPLCGEIYYCPLHVSSHLAKVGSEMEFRYAMQSSEVRQRLQNNLRCAILERRDLLSLASGEPRRCRTGGCCLARYPLSPVGGGGPTSGRVSHPGLPPGLPHLLLPPPLRQPGYVIITSIVFLIYVFSGVKM